MAERESQSEKRILIVDDDPKLQQLLSQYLGEQGYITAAAANGREMDDWLRCNPSRPDLVIMDLMLPGEDGLSLARRLRGVADIPIIMLTARGDEIDRIIGLETGADDYLPKPFNPRELLARIRAVMRRQAGSSQADTISSVAFGEFTLDLGRKLLFQQGQEVGLTTGEMSLLMVLAQHPEHVLSRDQLMDMLKRSERDPFDRSIDVRITRLRRKIEADPSAPRFIRTVWGQGYRFTPQG